MESLCNMARREVEMEKKMENLAKMVEQQGEALGVLQRSVAKLQQSVSTLANGVHALAGTGGEGASVKEKKGASGSKRAPGVTTTGAGRFKAMIWRDGKNQYIGTFGTEQEAADAHAEAKAMTKTKTKELEADAKAEAGAKAEAETKAMTKTETNPSVAEWALRGADRARRA